MEHMSACDHFTQHAWRPDLCSTCQRAKSEHNSSSGSRSWRRKSEPNPNNAITGVRISTLASKFQVQEMPVTEAERAKTLDRKPNRNSKEKQLNKCLSTELFDSSTLFSSSSAFPDSLQNTHHLAEHSPPYDRHTKTDDLKSRKSVVFVSRSLVSSHISQLVETQAKPTFSPSIINSSHAAIKTSIGPSTSARVPSQLQTSGLSYLANKSNSSRQSGSDSCRKHSIAQSSLKSTTAASLSSPLTSILKSHQAETVKEVLLPKEKVPKSKEVSQKKEISHLREKHRVSILDLEPAVIGHDGGLDNLFPEEESSSEEDNGHLYMSLTDEEKQFALLALGNTIWNSDTRNLQVDSEVVKRTCREFEDLNVDQLWSSERFSSLVDCDATGKRTGSGTFPQISHSKQSKISLKNITFGSDGRANGNREGRHTTKCVVEDGSNVRDLGSCRINTSHEKNRGSVECLKRNSGISSDKEGSADSGVEVSGDSQDQLLSNTVSSITDSLYKSSDCCPNNKMQPLIEQSICGLRDESLDPSIQVSHQARCGLTISDKNHNSAPLLLSSPRIIPDEDDLNSQRIPLVDNTAQEGFQAIDLLNDVLKDYGDLDESSTDDVAKNIRKETLKGKKSSDFEARMASVAATLDLAKQQRGKRQAPRPPVSPPPEPDSAEGISPKKIVNQPDPVFKMVTIGKSIVTLPAQQDMPTQDSKPTIVSYGLDDFGSLPDMSDNNKTNGDGKSKKGITSFFRNILRRGKDSLDSFESANPDVQLNVKVEKDESAATSGNVADEDLGLTAASKAKASVMSLQDCDVSDWLVSCGGDGELDTVRTSSSVATAEPPVSANPSAQRKISVGLASPTLMLRKAATKCSLPTSHHTTKAQEKEQDASSLVAKPYPAPKPGVPLPAKPASASEQPPPSEMTVKDRSSAELQESTSIPNVHRRPKSPKRTAPPVPPTRTSAGTGKTASSESRNIDLAKELEWRLKKCTAEQSGAGTLSRTELRESTRRSLPMPPSPPGERKEKVSTTASGSPPVSPTREVPNSLPSSPSSSTGVAFDFIPIEWSGGSTSTIDEDLPKFAEKIELPTVATQSRKGFLGKLAGNRKSRAPQPPVKRAKSITQSSTLPRGEKKSKRINVTDISGPVIVTDMTNSNVIGNRRNTISLGDEPAFVGMSASCLHLGPSNSTVSMEKGSFDEFDFPVLSPLGSLENLYESILPKPEGISFNYYDPPTSPKVFCPNIPADGYLEPVPPLSSTVAVTATSTSPSLSLQSTLMSVSLITTENLSSSSSASSVTTNVSVVKPPPKSQTSSSSKNDKIPNLPITNSKDSGSPHSIHTTSTSSSEANFAENSGNSIQESNQISSRIVSDPLSSSKGGGMPNVSSGLGQHFIEPEMTEQRRILLASQPIYEEIPNGGDEEADEKGEHNRKMGISSKCSENVGDGLSVRKNLLSSTGAIEVTKSQVTHTWLQLQQSHFVIPSSSSAPPTGSVQSSPSRSMLQNQQLSLSSQIMSSSLTSTSLTSSLLPPPPPPPEHLPVPHSSLSCSISKETVSSESDTQSNCSYETQSNCSTLSRPRPAPRQKPKRPEAGASDQYVSMNRPNAQVSLSEDKLRDVFTKLTSITFHALQDIYAQCEKILSEDRLAIPNSRMLKWADFDIYGQPLHASGRCVVYNAKLRASDCPCQLMILHSRPATEMCTTSHPSLLRPSAVFADTIPFSFLTPDFIKTSQLLQNSVYDSSQARCFVAVGAFDIVENLDSHLALLRETLSQDLNSYLNIIMAAALQLLSAMSHCLDQGFSVTETDYSDVFLITRSDLRGKVVAFLPRQRSLDVPQGEAMCNFLDRLLSENMPDVDDDSDDSDEVNAIEKIISSPKKVVMKLRCLLAPRKVECLGQVRTAVEYLLWGPAHCELLLSPAGEAKARPGGAGWEQELYVWLEKERLSTVGRLARNVPGLGAGVSLEQFYTLKFLLKTSAACLAESCRQLSH